MQPLVTATIKLMACLASTKMYGKWQQVQFCVEASLLLWAIRTTRVVVSRTKQAPSTCQPSGCWERLPVQQTCAASERDHSCTQACPADMNEMLLSQQYTYHIPFPLKAFVHTQMHARTHTCTHAHTHARTHAHARKHARMHAHTHLRTHVRMHPRMHAHMHLRTHVRMHGCTHTCTHAQARTVQSSYK